MKMMTRVRVTKEYCTEVIQVIKPCDGPSIFLSSPSLHPGSASWSFSTRAPESPPWPKWTTSTAADPYLRQVPGSFRGEGCGSWSPGFGRVKVRSSRFLNFWQGFRRVPGRLWRVQKKFRKEWIIYFSREGHFFGECFLFFFWILFFSCGEKEGRQEGRKGRMETGKEGRKGRMETGKEGRKEGKEGREEVMEEGRCFIGKQ